MRAIFGKRLATKEKICYNRRERKGRNAARRRRLCATHPRDGKNIAGNAGENIDNAENVWYNLFVIFYYDKCLLRGIFPYKGEKKEKNNAFV